MPRYARFECPDGDSTFSVHKVDKLPLGEGIAVYLEIENLDEYVLNLKEQGVENESPPHDETWLWREARLTDPDSNQLVLFYAGHNRKNPPWRIE